MTELNKDKKLEKRLACPTEGKGPHTVSASRVVATGALVRLSSLGMKITDDGHDQNVASEAMFVLMTFALVMLAFMLETMLELETLVEDVVVMVAQDKHARLADGVASWLHVTMVSVHDEITLDRCMYDGTDTEVKHGVAALVTMLGMAMKAHHDDSHGMIAAIEWEDGSQRMHVNSELTLMANAGDQALAGDITGLAGDLVGRELVQESYSYSLAVLLGQSALLSDHSL